MSSELGAESQFLKKVGPNLYRSKAGTYYLLVKRAGKQFRRSLKTNDLALARRRLRDFQDKAGRLSTDGDGRNIKFKDLAVRWLDTRKPELKPSSYERCETAVKALGPYFDEKPVRSIGLKEINFWKGDRSEQRSARTWNIEMEVLKAIFKHAVIDLKILLENPLASVKREKVGQVTIVIPTKPEFRVLVEELREGHRSTGEAADFTEFLAYSGCRKQEGSAVEWPDVHFDKEFLSITGGEIGTKNHDRRIIPLFPPLKRLLLSIQARSEGGKGRIFGINSARQQMHRACERRGLPLFGHHAMRHFFCSNAIEAGVDFKTIAEWLGHKDGGVLVAKTYGHLRAEHSRAMALRITFDAAA